MKMAVAMAGALLFAGCAINHEANEGMVLQRQNHDQDYTFANWLQARENEDGGALPSTLVFLTFSGGGARAAATSLGVLELLESNDKLKGSIALISATSGGSVTAATYAADGTAGLKNLNDNFLAKRNMGNLTARLLPLLFVPGANRAMDFSTFLDGRLFEGRQPTFDSLRKNWPNAPFVVLNATDMGSGRDFQFTQESFNEICTDLNPFSLTAAISASASFPFLLNPLPLRNYWADYHPDCKRLLGGEPALSELLNAEERMAMYRSPERLARARYAYALEHSHVYRPWTSIDAEHEPDANIQYLHLLDGGLADNLAARSVMRILAANFKHLQKHKVVNVLIIQVNAKSVTQNDYDDSGAIPGWLDVFWSVTLNPIDVATELSSYSSRLFTTELASTTESPQQDGKKINVLTMPVDFTMLDRARRLRAQRIATNWSLSDGNSSPDALAFLKDVAKDLLRRNPCYQMLEHPGTATCSYLKVSEVDTIPGPAFTTVAEAPAPAPASAAVPVEPPPSPPPVTAPVPSSEKVTYAVDAFFDFDKAVLKAEAKAKLEDLVSKIKGVKLEVIIAVGHTDSVGTEEYNQRLSVLRAEAIKAYLTSKGIEPSRVYTEGKGKMQPIGDNKTAAGRAQNRRVEIEIIAQRPPNSDADKP